MSDIVLSFKERVKRFLSRTDEAFIDNPEVYDSFFEDYLFAALKPYVREYKEIESVFLEEFQLDYELVDEFGTSSPYQDGDYEETPREVIWRFWDVKNPSNTLYIKMEGTYSSYEGCTYKGWKFVTPVTKTVTIYE